MAEEEKQEKKSGKLKWIIILVVLLGLLGGGGFVAWKFFMQPPEDEAAQEQAQVQPVEGEQPSPEDAQIVTLPPFLVNLADPLGRRYIKMTLDVEVINAETAQALEGAQAKVRDAVILLLSSKSYADLAPLENKILLKNELVTRLNQILGGSKIIRVYFTELVIQ